ncbi:MAG: hypothetical protein EP347_11470 [Alphaproteobacteria bacterium]|nr:MAG: hypothetical protein EP347_11470 [Alphaproteobacteria bacterium]
MLGVEKFVKRLAVALTALLMLPVAASAEEILVPLDEAVVFSFDEDIATVAVGNPAIAGVSIHDGRVVLVAGRTFGTTNVVALNSQGKPIGNKRIRVTSVGGWSNLTLVKGDQNDIISFTCAPRCERAIVPGDSDVLEPEGTKVQTQNDKRAKSAADASQ